MGTTILSFQDRVVIETLHKEHYSLGQIASRIGFSRTTVLKNYIDYLDLIMTEGQKSNIVIKSLNVVLSHTLL